MSLNPSIEHTPSPQPTQGPVESTASPSESSVPTLPESMSPSFSLQPTKKPLSSETDFPFPSPSSPPVISPSPVASTQVYMDWVLLKCVASCEGPPPCGGKAQVWNELFDSVADCCTNYFTSSTLVTKCLAPDIRNSISPTTVPLSHMPTTTSHWFMNYDDMECVLDNDSRQPWQKLYSSKVICCQSNGVVCT
ncbi:hypothetical protein THAPSDRAFT_267963 [Thalassiosira pseudonana CCMP1335]|uniref:Uncharacterized protein n=1 Tax=Thalassiosira pseudonana TaxID=35128 RepID=B8BQ28_THAPS|nr:hypothetical protein THAPSDRAFT_267963 [Thalassiosira pseudonana CCMP1335]EED95715.1 hypothetical protein THAPSDRAFT_267963 [Thalassiosira pseudonana CCMP1335]